MSTGRTVLVTGSAGFVGRHMVAELKKRGYSVHGWDIAHRSDCLDVFNWKTSLVHYDLVVHCAASAPHREAIDKEPVHMARNLKLDAALFDWAVRTEQGRVLYFSSSAAYPVWLQDGKARHALRESDVEKYYPEPDSVYGWTKLTGEKLAEEARKTGLAVTVLRPFSGYGEGQSENFPFRALIERARRKEDPFVIWGDGAQVRDWIHIDDLVAGALAVAESGTADPVNLCTGVGTPMIGLAALAHRVVGYSPEIEFRLDKPAGVQYRVGDPTTFQQYYVPKIQLSEGVLRALGG